MNKPNCILFMSQDMSYCFAKTTDHLASAAERLGIPTIIRDGGDIRNSLLLLSKPPVNEKIVAEGEKQVTQKLHSLIDEFGVDCIMSLDLCWLTAPEAFVRHPSIRRIYSLWYDDFMSFLEANINVIYPFHDLSFQDVVRHPKVIHSFYGIAMARECKLFGFDNQISSNLAAPREFLDFDYPCEIKDKVAFIGNPGFRGPPNSLALERMDAGADLRELREISRLEILKAVEINRFDWAKAHEDIPKLLAIATAAKMESPFLSTVEILEMLRTSFPDAFEVLNKNGTLLKASWAVKLVVRYDRPALVRRMYKLGLCDVISNPSEWEPYAVDALESITAHKLPPAYMRYSAHLNASNCLRDATANEKLFEISACGRTSVNLRSHDVQACYGENEIYLVDTLAQAEDVVRHIIAHPDEALQKGKRARHRTAMEHTWEHRLAHLFQQF